MERSVSVRWERDGERGRGRERESRNDIHRVSCKSVHAVLSPTLTHPRTELHSQDTPCMQDLAANALTFVCGPAESSNEEFAAGGEVVRYGTHTHAQPLALNSAPSFFALSPKISNIAHSLLLRFSCSSRRIRRWGRSVRLSATRRCQVDSLAAFHLRDISRRHRHGDRVEEWVIQRKRGVKTANCCTRVVGGRTWRRGRGCIVLLNFKLGEGANVRIALTN